MKKKKKKEKKNTGLADMIVRSIYSYFLSNINHSNKSFTTISETPLIYTEAHCISKHKERKRVFGGCGFRIEPVDVMLERNREVFKKPLVEKPSLSFTEF